MRPPAASLGHSIPLRTASDQTTALQVIVSYNTAATFFPAWAHALGAFVLHRLLRPLIARCCTKERLSKAGAPCCRRPPPLPATAFARPPPPRRRATPHRTAEPERTAGARRSATNPRAAPLLAARLAAPRALACAAARAAPGPLETPPPRTRASHPAARATAPLPAPAPGFPVSFGFGRGLQRSNTEDTEAHLNSPLRGALTRDFNKFNSVAGYLTKRLQGAQGAEAKQRRHPAQARLRGQLRKPSVRTPEQVQDGEESPRGAGAAPPSGVGLTNEDMSKVRAAASRRPRRPAPSPPPRRARLSLAVRSVVPSPPAHPRSAGPRPRSRASSSSSSTSSS